MGFNYSKEKLKFDKEWKKIAEWYKKEGMSDSDIEIIRQHDWEWFKSQRRYYNHTDILSTDSENYIYLKYEQLSVTFDESDFNKRYSWIDTIGDIAFARKLKMLPKEELEIITLYIVDEYSQADIARRLGITRQSLNERLKKIKKFLKNF